MWIRQRELKNNPRWVFLIDGLGAFLTGVFLLGILAPLERYFGMPHTVLLILYSVAFGMFLYSIGCYYLIRTKWKLFLSIIMAVNIIYVIISIGFIIVNFETLTALGITYFILEVMVIAGIVFIEYNVISSPT